MRHNSSIRIWLGPVGVLSMIAAGHAQETSSPHSQTQRSGALDRATALMRRESEARIAERERVFDRIKELAPAPVPAANVDREIVLRNRAELLRANRGVNGLLVIQVLPTPEVVHDDDAEGNAPAQPKIVVAEQSFDRYMFGSFGGRDPARRSLESPQVRRVETIVRQHHLNADQEQKLLLAARGDVKRIDDQRGQRRSLSEVIWHAAA